MKIRIELKDDEGNVSKEITAEADKDRNVSIEISETGKIEFFSAGVVEDVIPPGE